MDRNSELELIARKVNGSTTSTADNCSEDQLAG
jgi:hypothetical protein